MLKLSSRLIWKFGTAGVGQTRRVAFTDVDEDAAELAAELEVVPAAQDADVAQDAERAAVLDRLLRSRQGREARHADLRRCCCPVRSEWRFDGL